MRRNSVVSLQARLACAMLFLSALPCFGDDYFVQTNLVSNVTNLAAKTDPNLKNPWGMSFSPTSPIWISNQLSGTSTLYSGSGGKIGLTVSIPAGTPPVSGPTGQVFNSTTSFDVNAAPAPFIFDTLNGTIAAWNGSLKTNAMTVASTPGAIYTGLAIGSSGGADYLYAADNTGHIRVFNSSFQMQNWAGKFVDPNSAGGYSPFNIQTVGSQLYVTYAKLTPTGFPLPGGYVDVYNMDGTYVKRFASAGPLQAPWGVTMAPASFGQFANDLLIGNFGNGEILAYSPTGTYLGTLDSANGSPLVNDYLWALNFDPGAPANPNPNGLYFTAGIDNQQNGLFGEIFPVPEPATFVLLALGIVSLIGLRKQH